MHPVKKDYSNLPFTQNKQGVEKSPTSKIIDIINKIVGKDSKKIHQVDKKSIGAIIKQQFADFASWVDSVKQAKSKSLFKTTSTEIKGEGLPTKPHYGGWSDWPNWDSPINAKSSNDVSSPAEMQRVTNLDEKYYLAEIQKSFEFLKATISNKGLRNDVEWRTEEKVEKKGEIKTIERGELRDGSSITIETTRKKKRLLQQRITIEDAKGFNSYGEKGKWFRLIFPDGTLLINTKQEGATEKHLSDLQELIGQFMPEEPKKNMGGSY
jgi:hypothetical protein